MLLLSILSSSALVPSGTVHTEEGRPWSPSHHTLSPGKKHRHNKMVIIITCTSEDCVWWYAVSFLQTLGQTLGLCILVISKYHLISSAKSTLAVSSNLCKKSCYTYINAVSAAQTCPQSDHRTGKEGHAATVPIVLSHLTGQDTWDERCTKTWRGKTIVLLKFSFACWQFSACFHKHM